jgi:hypothetical protein
LAEPNRKPSRGQKGHIQPITRHPLFPAIVSLWFFALLGAGSFVASGGVLESLVVSNVDAIIPATSLPPGVPARLVLALALAAIGGGIGWMLARRVAAPEAAPAPQVFRFSDLDDTLSWPGLAEPPSPVEEPAAQPWPAPDPHGLPDPVPEIVIACGAELLCTIEPSAAAPEATALKPIVSTDLDALSHVELVERLEIALRRRQDCRAAVPAAAVEATTDPVIRFPGLADRRGSRVVQLQAASWPAPKETEKALRDALAMLQRMSGGL